MDCLSTLITDRLVLTPLQLEDSPIIQELFPCWEVVRYLDRRVPWPYPEDGALIYVRDIALPAMAAGREWHWMIRMRDDASCTLGSISLYDQPGNNRGFWLVGKGLHARGMPDYQCLLVRDTVASGHAGSQSCCQ